MDEADGLLQQWGAADAVWASVGEALGTRMRQRLGDKISVGYAIFCARGIVAQSENIGQLIGEVDNL